MTTTAEAPAAPELITTAEQLRTYLDTHPTRHAPQDDGTCACGWPGLPAALLERFHETSGFPDQDQHAEAVLTGDLGGLLASDTSDKDDSGNLTPVTWRALTVRLYEKVDELENAVDPSFLNLMRWCLNQGHADIERLTAITGMPTEYLGRLLAIRIPEELAGENTENADGQ